jgi:hypothetical protein
VSSAHHIACVSVSPAGGPHWLFAGLLVSLAEESAPARRVLLASSRLQEAVMKEIRGLPGRCRPGLHPVSATLRATCHAVCCCASTLQLTLHSIGMYMRITNKPRLYVTVTVRTVSRGTCPQQSDLFLTAAYLQQSSSHDPPAVWHHNLCFAPLATTLLVCNRCTRPGSIRSMYASVNRFSSVRPRTSPHA